MFDESKHPRDKDGKFTDGNGFGYSEEGNKLYNSVKSYKGDNNTIEDNFDYENDGRKWQYYQKDGKYYEDYFEKYGEDYKKIGYTEISRSEYLENQILNYLNKNNIEVDDVEFKKTGNNTGDSDIYANEFLVFKFGNERKQTDAWKKLHQVMSDNMVENTANGLTVRIESNAENKARIDREKETFVKQALNSGKYKGTPKEVAKQIFSDSPYSIHSAEQIKNIVRKELNVKEDFTI